MGDIKLTIENNGTLYYPMMKDEITLEMERTGSPSKLSFTIMKDATINFTEGNTVRFYYKEKPMFLGYVFTKKRNKEPFVDVVAYDQLRYMKNEFSYVFANKTATEIIKMMCNDFQINIGTLEDTGYVIPSLIEDKKAIIDIALDALDETITNGNEMFVMYDNFGSLELKNIANMKTLVLIDSETAEDYDYESSIDDETYNKILLYYVDESTNDRIPFEAKDDTNIKNFGLLQYFEEVKTPSIGQSKADALLKLYDKRTRKLTINNAFGNPDVRGGSMVIVDLNLGDIIAKNYMVVEQVKHIFNNDEYTMELTMNGNFGEPV